MSGNLQSAEGANNGVSDSRNRSLLFCILRETAYNMKFYALEYPNHTTLLVKTPAGVEDVLHALMNHNGIKVIGGGIYNPKSFITLREVSTPDKRQKLLAQELAKVLIG